MGTKRQEPPRLKLFDLHWSATVYGTQTVQAFDEEDAREQFESRIHEDAMPEQPINASLDEIRERPEEPATKVKKEKKGRRA